MMELTATEISELKAILKNRKTAKPKSSAPQLVTKMVVGPHGRVTGRANVLPSAKPPAGHKFMKNDPAAKVGLLVKNGKAIHKSGRKVRMEHLDATGERLNIVVVDPDELPELGKGEKLIEYVKPITKA